MLLVIYEVKKYYKHFFSYLSIGPRNTGPWKISYFDPDSRDISDLGLRIIKDPDPYRLSLL